MVCLTVCSLSGIPEFQEVQPMGAVRRTWVPEPAGGMAAHPAAAAHMRLRDTTTDMNRAPTCRGLPIEISGRCALSVVTLRARRGVDGVFCAPSTQRAMMGKLLW